MPSPVAVRHMSDHVLKQLVRHQSRFQHLEAVDIRPPPLFVAMQGPQGSGKTYLTSRLRDLLTSDLYELSVAVLSIDDLYLCHDELVALAEAQPDNKLLHGRGQPGTHDVQLGVEILTALQQINKDEADEIEIPRFDKSLFGGEGDRLEKGTIVRGPVDIVIFEGWCVGFHPTTTDEIDRRWQLPVPGLDIDFFQSQGFRKEDVLDINDKLKAYLHWWSFFDTFIQIKPVDGHPYDYIYTWRLHQEHNMKNLNGGKGMSDDQVIKFVDRYIPGYVFFGDGVTEGGQNADGQISRPPWLGNSLQIQIGLEREVIKTTSF